MSSASMKAFLRSLERPSRARRVTSHETRARIVNGLNTSYRVGMPVNLGKRRAERRRFLREFALSKKRADGAKTRNSVTFPLPKGY